MTTIGALVISSSIAIQLFGWLNFIGLTIIWLTKPFAFTSVWCFYAAAVSGLLYFYFVERRIAFLQSILRKEHEWTSRLAQERDHLASRYPRLRKWFLQQKR